MTRNDYKRTLGESSYYFYLYDISAADQVFFELEEGAVGGPYLGPFGYYVVYLRKRTPPTNPLDMLNDRHFEMVTEDYARDAFTDFSHQALKEAQVSGLEGWGD